MNARSTRAEVRNPILALPSVRALQALDPHTRALLSALLQDLQRDARSRAQKSWDTHKPPLAAYWAAVGVYAGHVARAVRPEYWRRHKSLIMLVRQPGYPICTRETGPMLPSATPSGASVRVSVAAGIRRVPSYDGIAIARISYNGRIWPLGPWSPETKPIYDNRGIAA